MKRSEKEIFKDGSLTEPWTPIKDCSLKDKEDGCCLSDKQLTPECHVFACPRLHELIHRVFDEVSE